MTALSIQPPYPIFTEADGSPLENGFVYIGTANLNPVANPIAVFWDAALTIPAAQPIRTLNGYPSRSGTPARMYVNSDYSIRVNDSKGVAVYSAAAAADRVSSVVISGIDSNEVSFVPFGVGAVPRTTQSKLRDSVSLKDFGAIGNGVADDSTAIAAWLAHCYANNVDGYAPPGTYLTSTGHTVTYSASRKFQIRGAGKGATVFRKTGTNSGAVLRFTISAAGFLELNLHLQDFEVDAPGLSNVNGIEFDASALVTIVRVRATTCFVGLEAKGLLVSAIKDSDFSNNAVGIRFRRGTAGSQPYSNAVLLENVRTNGNTSWGIDYGDGSGLYIRECDVESNGTVGDTNTGGVIIRDTIDDESGFGLVDVDGLWLESNKGHSFLAQSATNGLLTLKGVQVYMQESTRAITIGAVRSATFENVLCPSANAEISCAAELQNYLGNVYAFSVTAAGASQVVGAYKTSILNGDVWTATKGAIGRFEVSERMQLARQSVAPTTSGTSGWMFQLANASGASDGIVSRSGVFRWQNTAGSGSDFAELGPTWFYPGADNTSTCGAPSRRWSIVYAATGTINTSDERLKTQFRKQSDAERRVALAIKDRISAFKFKDSVVAKGDGARWHFGVGAQTVADAFKSEGLNPDDYGLFCFDEWPGREEEVDASGNVVKPAEPAGNRYGIRYDELAMFILAAI